MSLTIKEVEDTASLARISLNEAEKEIYTKQLNAILDYVDKIKIVNTDNIEPLIHILPNYNVFRPDEVIPSIGQDKILQNATLVENGYFKVPRIM